VNSWPGDDERSGPGDDERPAIIETIVTTENPDGSVNCAAMGVQWGEETIVIRPYQRTRTLRNLRVNPAAVVHISDDILLFVAAALDDPKPPTRPASVVRGAVIEGVCSWREVAVLAIQSEGPRATVTTRVVARGRGREFVGFNRARAAVLEASILASRVRFMAPEQVAKRLACLQVAVDKTAGPRERAAMQLVREHIRKATGGL